MIDVSILGASGHSGSELVRILAKHPEVNIKYAQSRSNEGKPVANVHASSNIDIVYSNPPLRKINESDVVFLALPGEEAQLMAPKLKTTVIDLSPAHRFKSDYVYGLPEINREQIKDAKKIANPGCYATACILGIFPLLSEELSAISFDCKSGYSGGGKRKDYDFEDNVIPYSLTNHYQRLELAHFVKAPFSFTPHVVNAFRGLMATIHVFGKLRDIEDKYRKFYCEKEFVKIIPDIPEFRHAQNTPYCYIGGFSQGEGYGVVVSVIDNLLKGAASQAVQNMNIRFGFGESDGLISK